MLTIPSRNERTVILLCWFAYTATYVGRFSYRSSMLGIQETLGFDKPLLGAIESGFFIAYAIGQFFSGFLSRFGVPRLLMSSALGLSALMNLLFPLFPNPRAMAVFWILNGLVQSAIWCNVIRDISRHVREENFGTAIIATSSTFTFGMVIAYAVAALSLRAGHWQVAFLLGAAMEALAAMALLFLHPRGTLAEAPAVSAPAKAPPSAAGTERWPLIGMVAMFCLAGVALGIVRDGTGAWIPSVLYEDFKLDRSLAVLVTLGVSLSSFLAAVLNQALRKRIRLLSAMDLLSFALAALLLGAALLSLHAHSLAGAVAVFAGLTLLAMMVVNVLTNMLSLYYRAHIDAGFSTSIVNTFCYVGTSLATWGIGAVAKHGGWNAAFLVLGVVALAGMVVSALGAIFERRVLDGGPRRPTTRSR